MRSESRERAPTTPQPEAKPVLPAEADSKIERIDISMDEVFRGTLDSVRTWMGRDWSWQVFHGALILLDIADQYADADGRLRVKVGDQTQDILLR